MGVQATGLPTAVVLVNVYARPTVGLPLLDTGSNLARRGWPRASSFIAPRRERALSGAQSRNRYPIPRTVSIRSGQSFLRK
jgi:hypothetical protein